MSRQRAKAWCFTLNNFTDDEQSSIQSWVPSNEASYVISGTELGEEGTPHLQGYVEFVRKKSLSTLKKLCPRAHWERRKGSAKQASDYCKKDGNFFEAGMLSKQGCRTDLRNIQNDLDNGTSIADISSNYFSQWIQYRKSFSAYKDLHSKPRDFKSFVHVIIGATGLGKTRYVFHLHDAGTIFIWPGDRWFDGYDNQPIALLDDFKGQLEWTFLLRLLDRYPMRVPIKGSFRNWAPKKIYITSNFDLREWYPDIFDLSPLIRRITIRDLVTEDLFVN